MAGTKQTLTVTSPTIELYNELREFGLPVFLVRGHEVGNTDMGSRGFHGTEAELIKKGWALKVETRSSVTIRELRAVCREHGIKSSVSR